MNTIEHQNNNLTQEDRTWGMIAHLSAAAGLIIPFGNILGPLIVWLVKKDTMSFVGDQAKEALNFQIAVALALLISSLLMFVLIGFVLFPVVVVVALVYTVVAAMKANEGQWYRYPFTIRLIS